MAAAGVTIAALAGTAMPMHMTATAAGSGYAHIFFIMMENEGPPQIVGNTADAPFINSLIAKYASAPNYFGVTHPSLPNYLALLSGFFQNIWDDCPPGASVTCAEYMGRLSARGQRHLRARRIQRRFAVQWHAAHPGSGDDRDQYTTPVQRSNAGGSA
jgi:hypothetical protein